MAEIVDAEILDATIVEGAGPNAVEEGVALQLSEWRKVNLAPSVAPDALKALETTYLGGERFDLIRITDECRYWETVHVAAGLELGRRLHVVKEVLPHGSFTAWIEEQSGLHVGERQAQKYMRLAQAVAERGGLKRLADAPIGHAAALLSLPDAYLDEMAEKGTLDGVPMEEVASCSQRDLLKRIKQLKGHLEKALISKEKAQGEADEQRDIAKHYKERVGELALGLKAQPRRAELRERLEIHRKTIEQNCRQLENLHLEGVDIETAADIAAHATWCIWRLQLTQLQMRENLADHAFGARPEPYEYNENDALRKDFEDRVEVDPL